MHELKKNISKKNNPIKQGQSANQCITDLFLEQALSQPNSNAVSFQDRNLTFHELKGASLRLSSYLIDLGVKPDDCIGIFVEPSLDLMIGVWGILFSGGAYLPLSPEYPEDRLKYMIEDSRLKIVFSQQKLKKRLLELAPAGTIIVTLEEVDALNLGKNQTATHLEPGNLAYIIYTSGSTGKPKGVMIEHHSIVNQMHWLKNHYNINQQKVILQKTPMSFDAAQWEILAPSCGAKVIVGSPGIYRDPDALIETINQYGVTTLQCVPTLLQALLDTEGFERCRSLQQIFSGGEALSKRLAIQCLDSLPDCMLANLYGPTECTINSSAFTIDQKAISKSTNNISIGGPISNMQYYILNQKKLPVASEEMGELYIGGEGLARGYLHRPELTSEKFVDNPFYVEDGSSKLYKTGDLAKWNQDGTVEFLGRVDNQVKLRGYRVELDEIKSAIDTHEWIKNSAVSVRVDSATGHQNLVAFIELNPKEAALMDQGNHEAHHQSKESRTQVKAQLSNLGCRSHESIVNKTVIELPGKIPTQEQRERVFARKTYRFFEGGKVSKDEILELLRHQVPRQCTRKISALNFSEFGRILRYFGQYHSQERLLPKYGYASPGALYATQMIFEIDNLFGMKSGFYYYHPIHHQLILIKEKIETMDSKIKIHFLGKRSAIEPVYQNNIQEVLEIEAGHMVGLFEEILPRFGLNIRDLEYTPATKQHLDCADEDYYLGTFEFVSANVVKPDESVEIYVQSHPGKIADLPTGHYQYSNGILKKFSDELILKKHAIAINQQVYDRSSFGITVIAKNVDDWMSYINLGKKLQHLQMNGIYLGFMSCGYSSKTGNELPSARRMESILQSCKKSSGPSYFFVGGKISEDQHQSEGMNEDVVHMKGPAEMIRDDLIQFLPNYMIPNKIVVINEMPLTANGKINFKLLEETPVTFADRPFCAPRNETEEKLGQIWGKTLKKETVSVTDDFFEAGGNSLTAVSMIAKINKEFGSTLPLQVIFEAPSIEKLSKKLSKTNTTASLSRLINLNSGLHQRPIYCWPGLGGYAMNLRTLAGKFGANQPFYGIQAHGINDGEIPYATIEEMAAEDIKMIRKIQPKGPYTIWGYSFGARVAFEVAYQLEQLGETVDQLFLIAPGSPELKENHHSSIDLGPTFSNQAYVKILFSVFAGSISHPKMNACLKAATNEDRFISFVCELFSNLDAVLVKRIVRIVSQTYQFKYTFDELSDRQIQAPIAIFKARGDDYSFIENGATYSSQMPNMIHLDADHYSILRNTGVDELTSQIKLQIQYQSPVLMAAQ